jgi:hypothetical protein
MISACGPHCTTRLQNTHRTERREVIYLWHPWAGCIVQIHEVVEKASGKVARCSLDVGTACRSLELPMWMLDRTACASMRMDTCPRVDVAALDALTTLLAEVSVTDAAPSNTPVPGVQMASRDENRGGHDAVPAQCASRPSNKDDTVRSVCRNRRRSGTDAGVGRTSGGDPLGADTSDGAVAPRSRVRRSRSAAGGGAP